jgi:hypothetical protein
LSTLALPFVGCEKVESIHLVLAARRARGGVCVPASGFSCNESVAPFRPLGERISDSAAQVTFVADVITIADIPSCRATSISDYCANDPGGCAPTVRRCFEVPLSKESSDKHEQVLLAVDALRGHLVLDDAPRGPAIFRIAGTTQSCAELGCTACSGGVCTCERITELNCHRLVGCASSCPVTVGELTGDISLDLDAISEHCGLEVAACAGLHLYQVDPGCVDDACEAFRAAAAKADATSKLVTILNELCGDAGPTRCD